MENNKFFEDLCKEYLEESSSDVESEVDFEKIEEEIFSISIPYRDSTAFQKALAYIKKTDIDLYKDLILLEYREMTN